jgi:hypothetical protein
MRWRTAPVVATIVLALAGCTLGQGPPPGQACTLIGCGPSLDVGLVGEHVPTDFTLTVNSGTGDFVKVRCTEGNAEFEPPEASRWAPSCPAGGVTFQDFAPEELSVTVMWSDGEVSQEFAPVYGQSQPNGPACDPGCRSARIDVYIPDLPAYGDSSTWDVYLDELHGFSLRYPAQMGLDIRPRSYGYGSIYVGDQIEIRTSARDPLVCRGDCPMIEESERITIAGRDARQVLGYVGSIGGNTPQYFLMYLMRLGDTYASFILYAESRHATTDDPSYIRDLKEPDIDLFERMMQTLEILD